jgi:hypothetical protein
MAKESGMLDITKETDGTFLIKVSGEIKPGEMERELDKLIEMSKGVSGAKLLYDIRNFEMPGIDAMMVEFKKMPQLFGMIRRFSKAAVLAEAPWLRMMAEWEGVMIPGLEIRSFAHKDEKEARQWLES